MKLNSSKSYKALHDLLTKYWRNSNQENDDIAVFLGSMAPDTFNTLGSADSAYWEDWKVIWKEAEFKDELDENKLLLVIKKFIKHYEKLGLNLNEIIIEIEEFETKKTGKILNSEDWVEMKEHIVG